MEDWMNIMKMSSPDKPEEPSEGMTFPATKDKLVDDARKKNLPPEVIEKLGKLPDKEYRNISEVITSVGQ